MKIELIEVILLMINTYIYFKVTFHSNYMGKTQKSLITSGFYVVSPFFVCPG